MPHQLRLTHNLTGIPSQVFYGRHLKHSVNRPLLSPGLTQEQTMSSHQCCLRGSIQIKSGLTDDAIAAALAPLLDANGLSFDQQLTSGAIEQQDRDEQTLNLSIDFWGRGGYSNNEIDDTCKLLDHLVDGHGCLEMVDYDTGDMDSMITPLFIGETLRERNRARIDYAIDRATQWLEPAIDAASLHRIREYIASFEPKGEADRPA